MDKLKKCPFCGCKGKVYKDWTYDNYHKMTKVACYYAYCDSKRCPITDLYTEDYNTKEEAIKAWNTRKGEK